jgi:hypothetical protein
MSPDKDHHRSSQQGTGWTLMKSGNLKLARAGYFLIAVAVIFLGAMMLLAPQSTDPVELMRIAGQAAGVAGGVGLALIITDYLRRRKA